VHPSTCLVLAQGGRTVAWSGQSWTITTLRWDSSDSAHFLTRDILCGVTICFVSDVLQFHVCKMDLIFLCFRGMFWDELVYYTSGTVKAPTASVDESGETIDQTKLLVFCSPWIKKYHLVPVFIHLCSYPSLSSTRLICGFSSCTWDFCFGRHLCSDNFFLTFGQGKNDTNKLKFISLLQRTPATEELKRCYLFNLPEQGSDFYSSPG